VQDVPQVIQVCVCAAPNRQIAEGYMRNLHWR
jgi:hypothetical protein